MAVSNENNPRIMIVDIGDVLAGVALTLPCYSPVDKDEVKSVKLLNNAALSGDDTNNVQVLLRKKGGATLATHLNDVASGGLVQREGKSMTLGTASDLELADGDNLEIDVSHNGTGQALSRAKLQIELIA